MENTSSITRYDFLNNHFKWTTFWLKDNKVLQQQIVSHWEQHWNTKLDINVWNCANALVEIKTNKIITYQLSYSSELNGSYSKKFEFYISQLPTWELNDICFLLGLVIYTNEEIMLPNAFEFPENYPSETARNILKETYGLVLYHYQFFALLKTANSKLSYDKINEFKKGWNKGEPKCLRKLKQLFLSDGQNIYELLAGKYHTHNGNLSRLTISFSYPLYEEAALFKQIAKKYNL